MKVLNEERDYENLELFLDGAEELVGMMNSQWWEIK